MEQEKLFYDDIYEAIRATVMRLGKPKEVGALLWPTKPPVEAGQLLSNCLNRARPEKLSLDDLVFLAREGRKADCHTILAYLCEEAGYRPPQPIEPINEMAELQRKFIAAVEELKVIEKGMNGAQMRLGRDLKIAGEAR